MKSFLEQLIAELQTQFPQGLGKVCIVFPTQRAGLFFRKQLAKDLQGATWSPDIFSIENFFRNIAHTEIPDNLTLVMELYQVYRNYFPEESFDRFYHWGNMMLRDFDELDRYMVDARKLFRNVKQLKEIDAEFGFSPEEIEVLTKFWTSFYGDARELGILKKEFLRTWSNLQDIYSGFRKSLEARNLAYEGMIYRRIAEDPESIKDRTDQWEKIIFAGLYDPSLSEEKAISWLVSTGKALCYWDSDSYYQDDPHAEAGSFFRKSKLPENAISWKGNYFSEGEKKIEFIGAAQSVGQAKSAGYKLSKLTSDEKFIAEETVLVLPDENMLFPALYSIPAEVESINVTMGYPLKSTPLAALMNLLARMQKNSRKGSFYHSDVIHVLNHPYIQYLEKDGRKLSEWKRKYLQNGWIHISKKHLSGEQVPKFFGQLFSQPSTPSEIFNYLLSLLQLLQKSIEDAGGNKGSMESEFIFHYFSTLKRLHELVTKYNPGLAAESLWKLFGEISSAIRIPFTGEPLKGLQMMGFLETRALDFKNVFILSVNEGILPVPMRGHSFIPFAIRKGFGMNTHEHLESRYAYYFYRLLQRAENVYLFYNTETKSVTGGERSRYLMQLEYELAARYPEKIKISHHVIGSEISIPKSLKIEIQKSEPVLTSLKAIEKYSASSLSSYINCSLQFYFKYVAKLWEREEVEDTMDEADFGNVFHCAMKNIYSGDSLITAGVIETLKTRVNEIVLEAFREELPAVSENIEGKNLLLIKVISELVSKLLDTDLKDVPFRVSYREEKISSVLELDKSMASVPLEGIIDRMDEMEHYHRIIDYKTGRVNARFPENLDIIFSDPEQKIIFQTLFYGYLASKKIPGAPLRIGIYPLKKISEGILYPKKEALLQPEELTQFETGLKNLIGEILDAEIPFSQTIDTERCRYCSFKGICNREI